MEQGTVKLDAGRKEQTVSEKQFRFQDMQIWQRAADLSGPLFKLAETLDERRFFRFAEQLRAAVISITNNIAGFR